MLVLTRRPTESIIIAGNIKITVVSVGPGRVKLGIEAPPDVRVDRQEIHDKIEQSSDVLSAITEATAGSQNTFVSGPDTALIVPASPADAIGRDACPPVGPGRRFDARPAQQVPPAAQAALVSEQWCRPRHRATVFRHSPTTFDPARTRSRRVVSFFSEPRPQGSGVCGRRTAHVPSVVSPAPCPQE